MIQLGEAKLRAISGAPQRLQMYTLRTQNSALGRFEKIFADLFKTKTTAQEIAHNSESKCCGDSSRHLKLGVGECNLTLDYHQSPWKTGETTNEKRALKKFMILHFGFEQPTPEIMEAWGSWFKSIADIQVEQGGFTGGREISSGGTKDLPWGMDSITGYNIIEAVDLDAAEKIAQGNPYIASVRVYEIRSM